MPRKGLTVDLEAFFVAVALKHGAPMQRYFEFVHPMVGHFGQQLKGISIWVHNTPEGLAYVDTVTQFGEAKRRATHWYIKYARWYAAHKPNYHGQVDSHTVLLAASKYSWDTKEKQDARQALERLQEKRAATGKRSKRVASTSKP